MQYRLLDGTWSAYAWWSRVRQLASDVAPPVGAGDGRDASADYEEDPDFSEEFGAAQGFAGGSGFVYGEFERWV